jgi:hypothetical protein
MKTSFEYKGFTYKPEEEDDGDCMKIYHNIFSNGYIVKIADFDRYSCMAEEDFQNYIDAEMPSRKNNGLASIPLNSNDLKDIMLMMEFSSFHGKSC